MSTAQERLAELDKEIAARRDESARLKALEALFPDIKVHTNRWDRQKFISASVNHQVTDYDSGRNCGCCPDSPVEIWPYLKTPHGKVYSDPPVFWAARGREYGDGYIPEPGFESSLRTAGLPESMIQKLVGIYTYRDDDVQLE